MLLFLRVLCFILLLINFTQNIVTNEFCDIPDEHGETNNKCSVQSRYSQNRSELTSLLYIYIYISIALKLIFFT